MSKSIKLKNNTYIDSTGVAHNKKTLSKMITDVNGGTDGGICTKRIVYSCNLNDLASYGSGLYLAYAPCKNSPRDSDTGLHWAVLQINYAANFCIQMAFNIHSQKGIYYRRDVDGAWESWQTIL